MTAAALLASLLLSCSMGGVSAYRPRSHDDDLLQHDGHKSHDVIPSAVAVHGDNFSHSVASMLEKLQDDYDVPRLFCHATDKINAILSSQHFVGTTKEMKAWRIGVTDILEHGTQPYIDGYWRGKDLFDPSHVEWSDEVDEARKIKPEVFEHAQTYFIQLGQGKISIAVARLRAGGFDDISGKAKEARGGGVKDVRGVLCFGGTDVDGTVMIQQAGDGRPYPYVAGAHVPLKKLDLRYVIWHGGDAERLGILDIHTKAKRLAQEKKQFREPGPTEGDDPIPVLKDDDSGEQATYIQSIAYDTTPCLSDEKDPPPKVWAEIDAVAILTSLHSMVMQVSPAIFDLPIVEASDLPPSQGDIDYVDVGSNLGDR
eukprot:CAMPEP_0178421348 /NCGR_PEP_ID=MMETSP0689_2-20121128/26600_1 /TAXON_ID=160604 /ORGANISM="Amphidinium massartii, Strain CS-259" /LENGTH=369 /DNA_ID=CAMNT_0020042855 /DNA_START=191 /DNA_END=1300 /DNA_ORIENTATION=-